MDKDKVALFHRRTIVKAGGPAKRDWERRRMKQEKKKRKKKSGR